MAKNLTVTEFFQQVPDDDTCLDHLMVVRHGNPLNCPKCKRASKFHRVRKRPVCECQWCSHQISPMVGTPFEKSRTPLQKWFYAMYLFTTSRHGVPAKELQRQLGVTYKTAWRMSHELRKYMGKVDGQPPLTGHVEVDETYVGGKRKGGKRGRGAPGKTVVFGILERDGEMFTKVVPDASGKSLIPHIQQQVPPGTRVSSDEWGAYRALSSVGYRHETVDHSAKEYARDDVHVNGLEAFWARLKVSIRGTHVHVSAKHLPKYLAEFEYRFNMRKVPHQMFDRLLASF